MKYFLTVIILLIPLISFSQDFSELDSIIQSGIENKYYPGAQILIGDNNNIIYEKSYGRFTYDTDSPEVTNYTIYDLASVTKVIATTTAVMILADIGKIDLNDPVIKYIPEFDNNGKNTISILNLLLHNSGLKAWIPFYKTCKTKEDVMNTIYNIGLDYPTDTRCVYSDLNAILLGEIVERVTKLSFSKYCDSLIFYPLGMENTFFNPDKQYKNFIAPTEYDNYWRGRLLKGEVHDEAASLMGGVSGNAGLFSNAKDLYQFMRMILNNGFYYNPYTRGLKEENFCRSSVIKIFTKRFTELSYNNIRALGWETKPEPTKYRTQCGELFSENSFGHTGYTGTSVWCDRDRNLIVIFLTNRINPARGNEGIRLIRPEVHNTAVRLTNR
ncbi:MAG: serine hydrolase [Ignavibacteria bacterium]|nr:serine hydrolase [Ignavibacteria bacterium]